MPVSKPLSRRHCATATIRSTVASTDRPRYRLHCVMQRGQADDGDEMDGGEEGRTEKRLMSLYSGMRYLERVRVSMSNGAGRWGHSGRSCLQFDSEV